MGWQHTKEAVKAKWTAALNSRLRQDAESTKAKYGRLSINRKLVTQTWQGMLAGEANLPADWTKGKWVLVGIDPGIG